jgi:hypothetical protein
MPRLVWIAACSVAAGLLNGCTSLPAASQPQEYLDQRSGVTVTVADKPLVFARDRTERAANLRDYVTLVAASVNRAGKIQYVWIAYAWSTLDPLLAGSSETAGLVITADDRRIGFTPVAATPTEAGISVPIRAPPGVKSISHVFGTDLDTMGFLTVAHTLRLQVSDSDTAPYYELWEDGRTALGDFVRLANGR